MFLYDFFGILEFLKRHYLIWNTSNFVSNLLRFKIFRNLSQDLEINLTSITFLQIVPIWTIYFFILQTFKILSLLSFTLLRTRNVIETLSKNFRLSIILIKIIAISYSNKFNNDKRYIDKSNEINCKEER